MLEAAVWRISRNHELGTRIAAWSGMGLGGLLLAGGLFQAVRGDLRLGLTGGAVARWAGRHGF